MGILGANDRVTIRACLVLGIVCILAIDCVQCKPIGAREAVFDVVRNFGAKGDGRFDNTQQLMTAWQKVCKGGILGPARLVIPPGNFVAGELVFQGPCSCNPITLDIQGTLLAYDDPSAYQGKAWISVEKVDNIIVTGGGTINGRGAAMWQYADGTSLLPVSFQFQTVGFGKIYNIRFLDAMGFHSRVTDSHDITVYNLTIQAPDSSPNTDGMHISSTINLSITDSVIGTGDDCISIGHGCHNILVARVFCGPGHGLSIGSLGKRPDETDMGRVTIINCTLTGTTNGARIKTYHSSPKISASDIWFDDIVMNNVKNPIIIDQHYAAKDKTRTQQSSVRLSDIHFRNIRGTTISPIVAALNCSSLYPCQGIELTDINLLQTGKLKPVNSICSYAKVRLLRGGINPKGLAGCL